MPPGTPDLILLIIGIIHQTCRPTKTKIKRINKLNDRGRELREEIKQLEKLYNK